MCSHWCLFTLCCLLWYLNKYFHTNVSYSEILCYTYYAHVFHHVWLSLTGLRLVFSSLTLVHFGLRFDVWVFWFSLFDICFAVSPFYIPPKKYFFGVPYCHHEASFWYFSSTDFAWDIAIRSYWTIGIK